MENKNSQALAELDRQIDAASKALAAEVPKVQSGTQTTVKQQSSASAGQKNTWWTAEDAMTISSVILAFGIVVTAIAAWLVRKGTSGTVVLRVFGTILILVFSVFLVVAGYDDKQIAPVLGLLGTVAGYLLGKTEKERGYDKANNKEKP